MCVIECEEKIKTKEAFVTIEIYLIYPPENNNITGKSALDPKEKVGSSPSSIIHIFEEVATCKTCNRTARVREETAVRERVAQCPLIWCWCGRG